MENYKELNIWKRSMALAVKTYKLTGNYPTSEKYSLVDQIRRAATSVPSNIAEGCGRNTTAQIAYFINISIGSLCELETQFMLSSKLNFIPKTEVETMLSEIHQLKKMSWSYLQSLKK